MPAGFGTLIMPVWRTARCGPVGICLGSEHRIGHRGRRHLAAVGREREQVAAGLHAARVVGLGLEPRRFRRHVGDLVEQQRSVVGGRAVGAPHHLDGLVFFAVARGPRRLRAWGPVDRIDVADAGRRLVREVARLLERERPVEPRGDVAIAGL
ncbi:MAG TPA: hypothetical protein VLT45_21470 [Kofleriaceae bacterium]|nr:hypothetical protein [Kofleriaceae bacterium]